MQHENDRYNYQGKQYQFIGFDEATQFTKDQYLYLFSRCRTKDPTIKCRFRATSNPGGVGHAFIKDRFKIGLIEPGITIHEKVIVKKEERILTRVFIPGKLEDNPSLLENDPDYIVRLMQLPEIERMRLMEGIWDAFEGQAFPELNQEVHGIPPFDIPPEWPRYRAFDWGYSTPFAVMWFAVDYDGRIFVYREWYGSQGGENPNRGIKMSPTEISRGIKAIERGKNPEGANVPPPSPLPLHSEKVNPGPADPDCWNPRWKTMGGKRGFGLVGDSPAIDFASENVHWLKADNAKKIGRQQVHKRFTLAVNNEGKEEPQILIFNSLKGFWRTMPLLRESENDPEDLESKNVEDHLYCVLRYFCMFKPTRAKVSMISDSGSFQHERRKMIKAKELATRTGISMQDAYSRVR